MQYSQEDRLNMFLNEELNQQIKSLLVNPSLKTIGESLEEVRAKINGSLEGVCNESRKFAESLSNLVVKTLRVPTGPLPLGQKPKKYAALSDMYKNIQLRFRDHQDAITREAANKLVHYLKVIGFAGNAASHSKGPVPISKYDKICTIGAVLESVEMAKILVKPNTMQRQQGHKLQVSPYSQASNSPITNVLMITNIATGVDENILIASIRNVMYIEIVKCTIKEKNGFRRAFLTLKDAQGAKSARDALDGIVIKDQKIKVELHVPQTKFAQQQPPLVPFQQNIYGQAQQQQLQSAQQQPPLVPFQQNIYGQAQQQQLQPVQQQPPLAPFQQNIYGQSQNQQQPLVQYHSQQSIYDQPQSQQFPSSPLVQQFTIVLSKQEGDEFKLTFRQYDPYFTGKVTGDKARPLFLAFGLSDIDLGRIWDVSDKDRDGSLNEDEFVTAMALLSYKKYGKIQEIASNYNIFINQW